MSRDNLYNQKWKKFLTRIWPFKFIPFVDFVLVAGSMATGDVKESSDFDVIVGVRRGRIFVVRALCILTFGFLGWRAKHVDGASEEKYKDKLCFSHFVTANSYKLSPPYNAYWKKLYGQLVPVYGDSEIIQKFYDANVDWAGPVGNGFPRGVNAGKNIFIKIKEWFLSGWYGDSLEKFLKKIQLKRIKKSLKKEKLYKSRIIYTDDELEFHPHTKRIEDFCENLKK